MKTNTSKFQFDLEKVDKEPYLLLKKKPSDAYSIAYKPVSFDHYGCYSQ